MKATGVQMGQALIRCIIANQNKKINFCFYFPKIILILMILPGCHHADGRYHILQIDSATWAYGKTIRDSVFDGVVTFRSRANKIVKQVTYVRGVIDGPCVEFYPNGSISEKYNISSGELNGEVSIYDTYGNIQREDYYYYGLRVGGSKTYENKVLISYSFYSLENKRIFKIRYDSLKYKKISVLETHFFFFSQNEYQLYDSLNLSSLKKEVFLYLPNPPKFKFQYDLVVVDTFFNVKNKVQSFDGKFPWAKFTVPDLVIKGNESLAIELTVQDTNMIVGDAFMFRKF